ncbi:hypothetical protein HOV93_27640 [Planctomycetes bacterium FF15]|uniref:Uncharacterized protein n=1 Tax=Bremerella alba TaxID=980252 RepID=A0A7V9A7P2_9BACT|nr:hypothetical protein [Bremerella alba]
MPLGKLSNSRPVLSGSTEVSLSNQVYHRIPAFSKKAKSKPWLLGTMIWKIKLDRPEPNYARGHDTRVVYMNSVCHLHSSVAKFK